MEVKERKRLVHLYKYGGEREHAQHSARLLLEMKSSTPPLLLAAPLVILIAAVVKLPNFLLQHPTLPLALDVLNRTEIISLTDAFGPESLAFDPQGGGPYTGVSDGRILKWDPHSRSWVTFAFTSPHRNDECAHPVPAEIEHKCGRPLGLRFHSKTGNLYIANAYLGLQVVGPLGGLATQLASQAEDQPFHFTNDLDIDEEDDAIYFTDTSTQFYRRQFILSSYTGDKTGRLMKYNTKTKEVTVLARGLSNANGVILSKNRSFVLVAETTASRITRYWLRGPKVGTLNVFTELPGYPDNVRRNSNGEFWVALIKKRTRLGNWILSNPWLGRLLLKLPLNGKQLVILLLGNNSHATILKLSDEGEIVEILEDSYGKIVRSVSEVEEREGKLWIGSVMTPFIGVYDLYHD